MVCFNFFGRSFVSWADGCKIRSQKQLASNLVCLIIMPLIFHRCYCKRLNSKYIHLLYVIAYLNYYLSFDVCACLRLSVFLSFCLSAKKTLSNGCTYQKMLVCKVVTFLKSIKMAVLFLIFLDQIRPNLIKLDQIGFLTNQKISL